jgi:hypothetical protein
MDGITEERDERDAGEMLLDKVFREDEFDREQAEALELAYAASSELRVPRDWLIAWQQVRQRRLADLATWRKVSETIEWGEWGFDYFKYFITKIAGALIAIEQTLAAGAARALLEAARRAMEAGDESTALSGKLASDAQAKRADKLGKFTSVVDKLFEVVELVLERGIVLGLRIWEMWTSVYDAPDCIRALYATDGRAAWNK